MAEALLRDLSGDRFEVVSAGTEPKGVHPRTIEVLQEIGIDVSGYDSKGLDRFLDQSFDHVITVCDSARQQCPVFPGATAVHWGFDDPASVEGDGQLAAFRRVRDEIDARLRSFVGEGAE